MRTPREQLADRGSLGKTAAKVVCACLCSVYVHVVQDLDKKFHEKETVMRNSAERRIRGYLRLVCFLLCLFVKALQTVICSTYSNRV